MITGWGSNSSVIWGYAGAGRRGFPGIRICLKGLLQARRIECAPQGVASAYVRESILPLFRDPDCIAGRCRKCGSPRAVPGPILDSERPGLDAKPTGQSGSSQEAALRQRALQATEGTEAGNRDSLQEVAGRGCPLDHHGPGEKGVHEPQQRRGAGRFYRAVLAAQESQSRFTRK